jgi:hypothetical protein
MRAVSRQLSAFSKRQQKPDSKKMPDQDFPIGQN